jgi:hypothetical protein
MLNLMTDILKILKRFQKIILLKIDQNISREHKFKYIIANYFNILNQQQSNILIVSSLRILSNNYRIVLQHKFKLTRIINHCHIVS